MLDCNELLNRKKQASKEAEVEFNLVVFVIFKRLIRMRVMLLPPVKWQTTLDKLVLV